jgi:probable rRNA maturation factor
MAVAIENRQGRVAVDTHRLRRAAARALTALGRPGAEVEIRVVDDTEIRRLNGAYRGVRRRTDVLAFPLELPEGAGPLLGQIVISVDSARRQARRLGVSLAQELELLVTHGVLHMAGYDDRDPVEAQLMHRRERAILTDSGAAVPERLWTGLLT